MAERAVLHVVSAFLINARGNVLLQQRDEKPELRYPGRWTLFGGTVEDGELPEQAIRRELIEERGLEEPTAGVADPVDALLVGHHEHDVGAVRHSGGRYHPALFAQPPRSCPRSNGQVTRTGRTSHR